MCEAWETRKQWHRGVLGLLRHAWHSEQQTTQNFGRHDFEHPASPCNSDWITQSERSAIGKSAIEIEIEGVLEQVTYAKGASAATMIYHALNFSNTIQLLLCVCRWQQRSGSGQVDTALVVPAVVPAALNQRQQNKLLQWEQRFAAAKLIATDWCLYGEYSIFLSLITLWHRNLVCHKLRQAVSSPPVSDEEKHRARREEIFGDPNEFR